MLCGGFLYLCLCCGLHRHLDQGLDLGLRIGYRALLRTRPRRRHRLDLGLVLLLTGVFGSSLLLRVG